MIEPKKKKGQKTTSFSSFPTSSVFSPITLSPKGEKENFSATCRKAQNIVATLENRNITTHSPASLVNPMTLQTNINHAYTCTNLSPFPINHIPVTHVPVTHVPVTHVPVTHVPVTHVPVTHIQVQNLTATASTHTGNASYSRANIVPTASLQANTNHTLSATNHTPETNNKAKSLSTHRESFTRTPGNLNNPMRFPANTKNAPSSTDLIPSPTNQTPASCRKAQRRTAIPKGQRLPADWQTEDWQAEDWQADIEAAVLESLSEEQTHWQEKNYHNY
ncbi:hypothetical protein HWV54_02975 [Bartonella alsatica]|uniref:Uncharacterized protein n=1 Tax=Bartonella alsatica TaxID=52764 RepID=A0ABX6QFG9_9HYPH|nr:hypothetical protein [Bartonella alsatica]QLC51877.1 hypothetical protein HWV54_02975 [Bartonella alsatica]